MILCFISATLNLIIVNYLYDLLYPFFHHEKLNFCPVTVNTHSLSPLPAETHNIWIVITLMYDETSNPLMSWLAGSFMYKWEAKITENWKSGRMIKKMGVSHTLKKSQTENKTSKTTIYINKNCRISCLHMQGKKTFYFSFYSLKTHRKSKENKSTLKDEEMIYLKIKYLWIKDILQFYHCKWSQSWYSYISIQTFYWWQVFSFKNQISNIALINFIFLT